MLKRVKALRLELGLTRAEVSELTGINSKVIQDIENKKDYDTRVSNIRKLALLYGCSMEELVEG